MTTGQTRIPAFCTQCRSRCGCIAVIDQGRLQGIEPDPSHPSGQKLCPKGKAAPELVYHENRLTHPLRRISAKGVSPARWETISWEVALAEIAEKMARIRADHGPEQVAFSVTTPSGTHMSDGIAWVERFIRAYGSPNTIYGTEICNWHKDFTTRLTYGADIGTPDFKRSDCILLWGHNPAATWLARSVEIQAAMRRGARLVVVDPRPTLFARRADAWLQVRPGADQALALGLIRALLRSDALDQQHVQQGSNAAFLVRQDSGAFLRESDMRTGGSADIVIAAARGGGVIRYALDAGCWLDDPAKALIRDRRDVTTQAGGITCATAFQRLQDMVEPFDPARVAEVTGVDETSQHAAADTLFHSKAMAYYAWNGVGQGSEASQTDRAISILYGLLGHYGQPGGNIPGAAVPTNDISGHDLLSSAQRAKALGYAERPLGPGQYGWVTARDVYRAAQSATPYAVRMLFSFGGNLLSAQPDTDAAKAAFKALELHVHADFFLNESAEYADIVLPVATSWEREGLRAGFDCSLEGLRKVQLRPAVIAPIGQSKSDIDIVLDLSARLGLGAQMFDCDVTQGYRHHLAPSGIEVQDLRAAPEGVTHAADKASEQPKVPLLQLYSEVLNAHGHEPIPTGGAARPAQDADWPLVLGSAKTVTYCHSQGRNLASLRRLQPDPTLEIAAQTAEDRAIKAGDWLKITTRNGAFTARAAISKGLAADTVFAQHGWLGHDESAPPDRPGSNLNAAVSTDICDPISGSIDLRWTACEVSKL